MADIQIAWFSDKDLREQAEAFLAKYHPTRTIPVPIEEIVEFQFGIDIVPLPGLQKAFEVDGFISHDLTTITVDEFVYQNRENRYRFTLAHELGHVVLHRQVFEQLDFQTIEDWKRCVCSIDARSYGSLEYQAYSFAGLVLVPRDELDERLRAAVVRAAESGVALHEMADVAREYVEQWLAKDFVVSTEVIHKRLDKENIWPPRRPGTTG